ncbi:cell wall-binding repeat-containing protein [Salinibacterium sp. SWN1162]|uniref:cell wall-binding repeat-containing protein n=1 Tax=Salinibacterium sp. SWN1162 TaxID=2792053 RepID=UPI0018CF9A2A|nr:cell wall-binding repeat-containing protein [Salinibacterium sp. SWN1162]MBH0008745.1 cell wall-binding repeat-containing protein [Salinibacterium sp. SWN1162]
MIALAVAASLVFSGITPVERAEAATSVSRLSGSDRYATAVQISKSGFKPGVPVVYIATGADYPDALSAASAAASQGGPLLLVAKTSIPSVVAKELARLKPGRIIVVGGTGAISNGVVSSLKKISPVKRISGSDRYATSLAIAKDAFSTSDIVYLATGRDFPDALSAAAAAGSQSAPVVLIDGKSSSVRSSVTSFISSLGASRAIVVGGTGAVSSAIEKKLKSLSAISKVTRLSGSDRYSTSVAVNKASFPSATKAYIATGSSYPDALAGAALAGSVGAPLYVVPRTCLPGTTVRSIADINPSKVTLLGGTGALSSSLNSLVACSPDAGYPRLLTVKAVPAGENQIKVSWTGQGRATKVAVIAGSEGSLSSHQFKSAWFPPGTTSITLTVPENLRGELGTGSGNPIFVKVATYNSLTASDSAPITASVSKSYRLSLAGTYTYAGHTPTTKTVRVAEWNVNSVAGSNGISGYTWKDRRKKVAAGIALANADVVAVVEATTAESWSGSGKTQWEDLEGLLASSTYGSYDIAYDNVGPAGTNTTKGAHLFFKPGSVTLEHSGATSLKSITSGWPSGLTDRYFAWATFTQKSNGKSFVAAAVHLPPGNAYKSLRLTAIKAVDAFLEAEGGGIPIVLMGDLNSSFAETPTGPQTALVDAGYYDASAAPSRSNNRYSTANLTNQIDNKSKPGYPFTPYKYKYAAPRIDYIFVKHAPGATKYVNQIVLSGSKFTTSVQGSDHNLQWAEIGIR